MRSYALYFLALGLLAASSPARSQSFAIGLGAGFMDVQSPEFYTRAVTGPGVYVVNGLYSYSDGLAFRSELTLHSSVDCFFENANTGISVDFAYAFLRGTGDTYTYVGEVQVPAKLTTKLDLWSLSVSSRYYLMRSTLSPFLSCAVRLNHFGELSFRYEDGDSWGEMKSANGFDRFGLSAGGGLDIALLPAFSTRLCCAYSWNNLDGHKEGEGQFHSIDVSVMILHHLGK